MLSLSYESACPHNKDMSTWQTHSQKHFPSDGDSGFQSGSNNYTSLVNRLQIKLLVIAGTTPESTAVSACRSVSQRICFQEPQDQKPLNLALTVNISVHKLRGLRHVLSERTWKDNASERWCLCWFEKAQERMSHSGVHLERGVMSHNCPPRWHMCYKRQQCFSKSAVIPQTALKRSSENDITC